MISTRSIIAALQPSTSSSENSAEEKSVPGTVTYANEFYRLHKYSFVINLRGQNITVGEKISTGSAIVYKAKWNEQNIIIKSMIFNDIAELSLYQNEKDILQKFSLIPDHPTVNFLGYSISTTDCRLVTEYLPQGSLQALLKSRPNLDNNIKYTLIQNIARAVAFMHKNEVAHYDIKPDNILLHGSYQIKLCDFGCSKKPDNKKYNKGTPNYVAPEVITKQVSTYKADIFSAAVTFWAVMSESEPYASIPHKTANERMHAVYKGLRETLPDTWPVKISKLITWGWQHSADNRPSANEWLEEMEMGMDKISDKLASLNFTHNDNEQKAFLAPKPA